MNLVNAINNRDVDGIEDVLDLAESKSSRPVIKLAIALAMDDTPRSIRIAITNLIGIDVMWD